MRSFFIWVLLVGWDAAQGVARKVKREARIVPG